LEVAKHVFSGVPPIRDLDQRGGPELHSLPAVIDATFFPGDRIMKIALAFAAAAMLALASSPADAKGCLKGAAVGGVAGHYAGHHGLLGAAAGCLYGRHRANEQEKQQQSQGRGNPRDAQGKM
jgi:hypothetical protein